MNIDWKNLQPCDLPSSITLSVDVMKMTWTGGVNGSSQERADGYQWTIPAGWSANGQTGPATINTIEGLVVTPASACSGGTISVKAYKDCFTTSYSNAATFDMNKIKPTTVIQASAGFNGSFCGNTQSVTFTAPYFPCATDYTWSVSAPGWLHGGASVFHTAQNTVTLVPSGNGTDAGTISVTATLSCGTTITSQSFALIYKTPAISLNGAICTGGKTVNLLNVASSGVTVTWAPDSKISIVSGQGTISAVMKQASVSNPGSAVINASVSCLNTSVPAKNVWVGIPNPPNRITGNSQPTIGSFELYTTPGATGAISYTWVPPYCYGCNQPWQQYDLVPISEMHFIVGDAEGYMQVMGTNECGTGGAARLYVTPQTGGGGPIQFAVPYPNPATKHLFVDLNLIPSSSRVTSNPVRNVNDFSIQTSGATVSSPYHGNGVNFIQTQNVYRQPYRTDNQIEPEGENSNFKAMDFRNALEFELDFKLYDEQGNLILQSKSSKVKSVIDIETVKPGNYILVITSNSGEVEKHRIVVK